MFSHHYVTHDGVVNSGEFYSWVTSDKSTRCTSRDYFRLTGWQESKFTYSVKGLEDQVESADFHFKESTDVKDGAPVHLTVTASSQILLSQILEKIEDRWPSLIL